MSYANRATSSSTGERQPIGKRERSPSGRRRIQTKAPTVGAQGVSRRPSQAPGPNWSGLTCRRSGGFAKPPTTTASMASHDPDDCLQLHLPLTCAKVAFLVPTHASVTTLMGSIFSTRSSWVGIMNLYSRLLIRQRQEDHLSPGVQPGQYSKIPLLNKINK
ncbi:PREDICTED: uncharacterized protein LOC106148472 isoform X2 [Chinchilla lanigera]|uniref:uncharacterized protein LOC106148472 isoform X2 n=1 Tax=Chinchilla lanigera TaxID=34839 RepID=UPI0006991EBD|nr:PREDICTED: uncharacterized protein LOC106148472 isoform X2 [Chinchilla lanigera]